MNLATGAYSVQYFFNGSTTAGLTINLTGTVAAGDVDVLAQATAAAEILAQADQTSAATNWYNGNDAVVLRKGTAVVDSIGQIGNDPGAQWGTDPAGTMDNTLRRKASVVAGDTNTGDAFDPSVEWAGFVNGTFGGLGCPGTENCVAPPDPLGVCGDPATLISAIQGAGATSPVAGSQHTIEGVVIGDFDGAGGRTVLRAGGGRGPRRQRADLGGHLRRGRGALGPRGPRPCPRNRE